MAGTLKLPAIKKHCLLVRTPPSGKS